MSWYRVELSMEVIVAAESHEDAEDSATLVAAEKLASQGVGCLVIQETEEVADASGNPLEEEEDA